MDSATALAIAAWIIYVYPYVIYPLILRFLDTGMPKPAPPYRRQIERISHIVCVHNEAGHIEEKISNWLELDSSRQQELIIVCDGCTDGTEEIAQRFAASSPAVKVVSVPHAGKTAAQNVGSGEASGEALIFSDTDTLLSPGAGDALADRLSEGYACVAADVRYRNGGTGDSLYIRLEAGLKALESRRGVLVGVQGGCYAVAAESFVRLPEPVLSDLVTPLEMLLRGDAVAFEPEARAYKASKYPDTRANIARRRRIFCRALNTLFRHGYMTRIAAKPRLLFYLVSDKLLRYFVGPIFLVAVALTIVAAVRSTTFLLAVLGAAFIVAGGLLVSKSGGEESRPKARAALAFLLAVNVASLMALGDFAAGKDYTKW